ncbi:MAG: PAP2 family protein [Bacteroidetes bacterium]|nr:MAG: PAP2 family protein [Bacteroidota bacterium]
MIQKETYSNLFSKLISLLFHPLLMPTYALIIILNSGTHYSYLPAQAQKIIYVLVFLSTFLIPVSIIPFLMQLKLVNGVDLKERKERIIPLSITAASYYFAFYLLSRLPFHVPQFLKILILASAILIVINLLINLKWKISSHLIGISGLLALIFTFSIIYYANLLYVLILITLVSGVIAFARLKLEAHSPMQIYAGFLIGFSGMVLIIYFSMF